MTAPALRVIVDGDNNNIYRGGDKVTGKVWLVVEEHEQIESLKLVFAGSCITKTSRPLHPNTNTDVAFSRQDYEEKIRLFNREKRLVSDGKLGPNKYSWPFEFFFPASTEPQYKRAVHGANYPREPHPLPPSFQFKTNSPGGIAHVSYFIQARLVLRGSTETKRCKCTLRYHPTPPTGTPQRARLTSSVLYGQVWKPAKDKEESRVKKVFSGVSMNSTPRIVPTLLHPSSVAPGQHIPLSLNLLNARDPSNHAQQKCTIDTLSVTISTYSTTMCGNSTTYPEDQVSKHITCILRSDLNKSIPFGKTTSLTSNFRLIDDMECIPTFKTYTITRRYTLSVSIGIKYNDQPFAIRSTTPLEILPRLPRDSLPPLLQPEDGDDVEPLPRYRPREPSREFAPDYESIYNALSRTPSSEHSALSLAGSTSSSLFSGAEAGGDISGASTVASTPDVEIEHLRFERVGV
ncbi:hypothetical protein DDE82_002711 [Stemphylium lycopersici]|uniref:Arrestin-like N-terminal domain-containing protein n=1 Tax=Stemphylium lycopersici TaxID=183478 RepID=A0A364N0K9_STELY|nr:hypothetical protein TW65_04540 [Stemphylium lycopersici]RAR07737.1 hypothetical protein DDE82_002711 [Stemphylium lycopersici]RAR08517.1 hypothetical protein DDE83_005923 [Stemphylium lycopersici]